MKRIGEINYYFDPWRKKKVEFLFDECDEWVFSYNTLTKQEENDEKIGINFHFFYLITFS